MSSFSHPVGPIKALNLSTEPDVFDLSFGQYTSIKPLGKGSYGNVYLVEDESGQQFALKEFFTIGKSEAAAKFTVVFASHEVSILEVRYPCAIKSEINADKQYILMPYLGELNLHKAYVGKGMGCVQSDMGKQVLFSGFAHLAQDYFNVYDSGLLHLDIKPSNIMFNGGCFCLADFGAAINYRSTRRWAETHKVSTSWYRTFEDIWCSAKNDPFVDPKPKNKDFVRHWPRHQSHDVNTDMYGLAMSILETYGLSLKYINEYIKARKKDVKKHPTVAVKNLYRDGVARNVEQGIHGFINRGLKKVLPQKLGDSPEHLSAFQGFLKFLTVAKNKDRMRIDQFRLFVRYYGELSRAIKDNSDLSEVVIPGVGKDIHGLPEADFLVASKRRARSDTLSSSSVEMTPTTSPVPVESAPEDVALALFNSMNGGGAWKPRSMRAAGAGAFSRV